MATSVVITVLVVSFLQLMARNASAQQFCDNSTSTLADTTTPLKRTDLQDVAPQADAHDLLLGNCDQLSTIFYDEVRCYEPLLDDTIYTIKQYRFSFVGASIHCVNVTDLVPGGGGYPARYEGGVGRDFIDIVFRSDVSMGMEFRVQVYARVGVVGGDGEGR